MHPLLNIATQAARQAGRIIAQSVDHLDRVTVTQKGVHDFVTEVDKLAEQEIIAVIRKSYPNHSILGEESGEIAGDAHCWVIDPLDGTTNFIHGFPHFSISIAVKLQNQYQVGLVYDPLRGEMFMASKGEGARLNERRIRVSSCTKLDSALLGTGFPARKGDYLKFYLKSFAAVFPVSAGVRRAGSAALDLAYVAAGRLDGFWEAQLKPWDMAAGCLLVQEAGGYVSDFSNQAHHFENGDVIAGTPKVHHALVEIIQPLVEK